MKYDIYEDKIRISGKKDFTDKHSPYCDFVYYESSRTPGIRLAMRVLKPSEPSYILVKTHGWHMSIEPFVYMDEPLENLNYLTLQVDMRGRAYSEGKPDCNGWELFDVIDAVNYARKLYKDYIIDENIVYFEGGSGGGGNAYSIIGKFPDFFAACTALCGISDYRLWYENDSIGEFRDEMDAWIGCSPVQNPMAYKSRSGLYLVENLYTPLFIAHGETDVRVPVEHARAYVRKAEEVGKASLVHYLELKGVGTRDHWGNATQEQMEEVEYLSEQNRLKNRRRVEIPDRGRLIVAGYIFTKKFSVVLDSIDKIAVLEYDLNKDQFDVSSEVECTYEINRFYT